MIRKINGGGVGGRVAEGELRAEGEHRSVLGQRRSQLAGEIHLIHVAEAD